MSDEYCPTREEIVAFMTFVGESDPDMLSQHDIKEVMENVLWDAKGWNIVNLVTPPNWMLLNGRIDILGSWC